MAYRLGPGVSYCRTSDATIFLNLNTDRYIALPQNLAGTFHSMADGLETDTASREALSPLVNASLLTLTDGPQSPLTETTLTLPTRSLLDTPRSPIPAMTFLKSWIILNQATRQLRTPKLAQMVSQLSQQKAQIKAPATSSADIKTRRCAQASERLRLIVMAQDKCLSRSIALTRHLLGEGCPATLVLGVKLHPFGAHAWVQQDDMVLNCRLDEVHGYSPILAV